MSNQATTEQLTAFIESHDSGCLIMNDNYDYNNRVSQWNMSAELTKALIKQLGGESKFTADYMAMSTEDKEDLHGFIEDNDALTFFDNNRADLLDALKRWAIRFDIGSGVEFIAGYFDYEPLIDCDVIAEAIYEARHHYDKSSYGRQEVCTAIARLMADDVCSNFADFMQEQQSQQ